MHHAACEFHELQRALVDDGVTVLHGIDSFTLERLRGALALAGRHAGAFDSGVFGIRIRSSASLSAAAAVSDDGRRVRPTQQTGSKRVDVVREPMLIQFADTVAAAAAETDSPIPNSRGCT